MVLHNDTDEPLTAQLELERLATGLGGEVLAHELLDVSVPARNAATYLLPAQIAQPGDASAEFIQVRAVDTGARAGTCFWVLR